MLAASLIISFIVYSVALFWLSDWRILLLLFVAELALLALKQRRRNWRSDLKFLLRSALFVSFVIFCNLWTSGLASALMVGARLLLALLATYWLSLTLTARDFARGFRILLSPLKICQVDVDDLALSIAIALSFVPILSREARIVRQSLRSKGFDFNLRNVLTRPQLYVTAYLDGMLAHVEAIERALYTKGYD